MNFHVDRIKSADKTEDILPNSSYQPTHIDLSPRQISPQIQLLKKSMIKAHTYKAIVLCPLYEYAIDFYGCSCEYTRIVILRLLYTTFF